MVCPSGRSAETLASSASGRPRWLKSRLWHFSDISCHNSERNLRPQVLFLGPRDFSVRREKMLASMNMMGFLLTKDYEQARAFYEGKLGFKFVSLDQFALVIEAGKSMIRIGKSEAFKPTQGTVLG